MSRYLVALFALLLAVTATVWNAAAVEPESKADETLLVDIRNEAGTVMIPAEKIVAYDWAMHTLTFAAGEREKLYETLRASKRLVSGVPFSIYLNGRPVYAGQFTSAASSRSFKTPVIVIDAPDISADVNKDQLRIDLGYPTKEFFKGEDPRANPRLKHALQASGKLKPEPPDHTEWLEKCLKEMQTIKPGMTRADLLKVFTVEGGISTRRTRRYVYHDCPYVKVNVTFEPVGSPDDKLINAPEDKIRSISQPFLEWTIAD